MADTEAEVLVFRTRAHTKHWKYRGWDIYGTERSLGMTPRPKVATDWGPRLARAEDIPALEALIPVERLGRSPQELARGMLAAIDLNPINSDENSHPNPIAG